MAITDASVSCAWYLSSASATDITLAGNLFSSLLCWAFLYWRPFKWFHSLQQASCWVPQVAHDILCCLGGVFRVSIALLVSTHITVSESFLLYNPQLVLASICCYLKLSGISTLELLLALLDIIPSGAKYRSSNVVMQLYVATHVFS